MRLILFDDCGVSYYHAKIVHAARVVGTGRVCGTSGRGAFSHPESFLAEDSLMPKRPTPLAERKASWVRPFGARISGGVYYRETGALNFRRAANPMSPRPVASKTSEPGSGVAV